MKSITKHDQTWTERLFLKLIGLLLLVISHSPVLILLMIGVPLQPPSKVKRPFHLHNMTSPTTSPINTPSL